MSEDTKIVFEIKEIDNNCKSEETTTTAEDMSKIKKCGYCGWECIGGNNSKFVHFNNMIYHELCDPRKQIAKEKAVAAEAEQVIKAKSAAAERVAKAKSAAAERIAKAKSAAAERVAKAKSAAAAEAAMRITEEATAKMIQEDVDKLARQEARQAARQAAEREMKRRQYITYMRLLQQRKRRNKFGLKF